MCFSLFNQITGKLCLRVQASLVMSLFFIGSEFNRRGANFISLLYLTSSEPFPTGNVPTFLSVANTGTVPNGTHYLCLTACFIQSIAHDFPVDGQGMIILGIGVVPCRESSFKFIRIDSDQKISDNTEAWHTITPFVITATKMLSGFLVRLSAPSEMDS